MTTYTNCKTYKTGLYKPHTINAGILISIIYSQRDKILYDLVAIAFDEDNNKYEIYKTQTIYGSVGFLAFPLKPDNIPGFYPWL